MKKIFEVNAYMQNTNRRPIMIVKDGKHRSLEREIKEHFLDEILFTLIEERDKYWLEFREDGKAQNRYSKEVICPSDTIKTKKLKITIEVMD